MYCIYYIMVYVCVLCDDSCAVEQAYLCCKDGGDVMCLLMFDLEFLCGSRVRHALCSKSCRSQGEDRSFLVE